jgi:hypothetical protein
VQWNNSILLQGDVAREVAKLKRQPGNELQVQGSSTLVRTLMKHGLVDGKELGPRLKIRSNGDPRWGSKEELEQRWLPLSVARLRPPLAD